MKPALEETLHGYTISWQFLIFSQLVHMCVFIFSPQYTQKV